MYFTLNRKHPKEEGSWWGEVKHRLWAGFTGAAGYLAGRVIIEALITGFAWQVKLGHAAAMFIFRFIVPEVIPVVE